MKRQVGYASLVLSALAVATAVSIDRYPLDWPTLEGVSTELLAVKLLSIAAVVFGAYGIYSLILGGIRRWSESKQRVHDVRGVLRLAFNLSETPVELEVNDRPTVNVAQQESWVELKVRYLVHPKRMQRTRNQLYQRVLDRFQENPDRISFPVGRPR